MTSTSESQPKSAEAVRRAAVMTHGKPGTIGPALERLERIAGDYRVQPLTTLDVVTNGAEASAVNDVVVLSATRGRMVELGWSLGHEDLGVQPCDGMICSTPTGSTAYNLSNGGPVLVRGLDAMAVTFIAPHSLDARPLVVPRGLEVTVRNATRDVSISLLVDGHRVSEVRPDGEVGVYLCE